MPLRERRTRVRCLHRPSGARFHRSSCRSVPESIDVYFENVGGAVFEAVFPLLNSFARIPVCGLISMYNATSLSPGPILLPHLMRAILTKRLTFRGCIVSDFFGRYGDFMHDVSAWVGEGRIKYREDVVDGLKNAPRALIGLLRGENFGKLLVRVAADDTRPQHKPI
jgi:NADPH-dependent curcumin reductase CurA